MSLGAGSGGDCMGGTIFSAGVFSCVVRRERCSDGDGWLWCRLFNGVSFSCSCFSGSLLGGAALGSVGKA